MLEGKVVLITGCATGLGKEIAIKMAREKANIIIHYNNSLNEAKKLKKELEEKFQIKCITIKCDLKEESEINNMCDEIYKHFSNVDILINNAALELNSEIDLKTKKDFMNVLNVNLIGHFLLSRYIGNRMYENKQGKIINISSNNAIDKYDPTTLEYDASKAALISLTHNLALHYAPYVNVNAVAPGWIKTEKVNNLNNELDGMLEQSESEKILKQRFGTPEEVADLVVFLSSKKADYINNEVIRIDGGIR